MRRIIESSGIAIVLLVLLLIGCEHTPMPVIDLFDGFRFYRMTLGETAAREFRYCYL